MAKELEILNEEGWVVDGPSLRVEGEHTLESYEKMGSKLKALQGFTQFWVGDWANALHDEHGYGAMTGLAEKLGYEAKTVQDYADVSRHYEPSTRVEVLKNHPRLSWSHFRDTASQPDRIEILEMAGREEMTTRELQDYVKEFAPKKRPAKTIEVDEDTGEVTNVFSWLRQNEVIGAEQGFQLLGVALSLFERRFNDDAGSARILLRTWRGYLMTLVSRIDTMMEVHDD